jgi:hypothetical protein
MKIPNPAPAKRPAYRPAIYPPGVKSRVIKVPCTPGEQARIILLTKGPQRLAVLLKLCDDIESVTKPQ